MVGAKKRVLTLRKVQCDFESLVLDLTAACSISAQLYLSLNR